MVALLLRTKGNTMKSETATTKDTMSKAMQEAIDEAKQFTETRGYKVNVYRMGFDNYIISACEVEGGVRVW